MNYQMDVNGILVDAYFADEAINQIFMPLLKYLTNLQIEKNRRIIVLLAAPPGAGKSTLASFLEKLSRQDGLTPLTVVGMDGFHHYQDYLKNHYVIKDGKEVNMVSIKGAPVTFDLDLFKERLKVVKSGQICGWPIYDRVKHNPKENALEVNGDIILVEGNYLLLEDDGWDEISKLADYTIKIDVDLTFIRQRLIHRKAHSVPMHEAIAFVDGSDLVNAKYVLKHSKKADLTLKMIADGKYEIKA